MIIYLCDTSPSLRKIDKLCANKWDKMSLVPILPMPIVTSLYVSRCLVVWQVCFTLIVHYSMLVAKMLWYYIFVTTSFCLPGAGVNWMFHLQGVSGKMAVFTHRWLFIFFCFTPQLISFSLPPFLSLSLLLPIRMPMGIGSELFVSRWENWKRNSVVFHLPSRTVC